VELFPRWWEYGFRSFRRRPGQVPGSASPDELDPKPYAITGRDGNDTTDRWLDLLMIETLYVKIESEEARQVAS
jgi:hypothetical protein